MPAVRPGRKSKAVPHDDGMCVVPVESIFLTRFYADAVRYDFVKSFSLYCTDVELRTSDGKVMYVRVCWSRWLPSSHVSLFALCLEISLQACKLAPRADKCFLLNLYNSRPDNWRTRPLGTDRHFRRWWFFEHAPNRLYCETPDPRTNPEYDDGMKRILL